MKPIKPIFSAKSVFLTLSLLLLSLAVYAATSGQPKTPAKSDLPAGDDWRVAQGLDDIMQPRFQKDAGRFGMDRAVSSLDGHPSAELFYDENRSEKRRLDRILAMKRPFVVAILHCAHKPGSHAGTHDGPATDAENNKPYTQPLAAAGSSEIRAGKSWDWADGNLDHIAVPFIWRVRHGETIHSTYGKWSILISPIRAERRSCLSCHAGAKKGDTLGAMIYLVKNTPSKVEPKAYFFGGGE